MCVYGEVGAFQVSVLMGQARPAVVGWSSGLGVFSALIRYHPLLKELEPCTIPSSCSLEKCYWGQRRDGSRVISPAALSGALGFLGATVPCLALDLGDF